MRRQRCILTLVLLMATLIQTAAHSLIYLNVDVCLHRDGSARVTEKRTCLIGDDGTEGYITMMNMGDIGISDLMVKDESGVAFVCEAGNWDTNRSRRQKAHRCGIHQIGGGVELCWGIGDAGMRTYEIGYTLTHLVKAYSDYDGFNHSFYEAANTPAQAASLTVRLEGDSLRYPTSRVWAFGFTGRVMLASGLMTIAASEPLTEGGSMIVMCQFDKGIFTPAANGEGAFAEVRRKAFEGSDYDEELYREQDEDSIPLAGTSTSLMGGDGFTGENDGSNDSSLGQQVHDSWGELKDYGWVAAIVMFFILIFRKSFRIDNLGGGSSSGSSSGRSSSRSSGRGGKSSLRGGGGHSGGGGSGFR